MAHCKNNCQHCLSEMQKQQRFKKEYYFFSIIIIMYFTDPLSYYLTINPSQAYFCSLQSPTEQVLSDMKRSNQVTKQIDRILYFVQIQPDNVQHRLALMMLKFCSFMKKMTIKQESIAFRQKRFRIFFSFESQEIQKDQFRNMLDYFKCIKLELMQHDKRKQLLLSLNNNQRPFQQILQSLNKQRPMLKLIQRNQLIQQYQKNSKLQACRSNGLYAEKINQTTYLVFTNHSKLRMKIIKKGEHFKLARLLNFAVQENYKIEIVIQIGHTVDCHLDITISTCSNIFQISKIKEIVKLILSQKIHQLYSVVQIPSKDYGKNTKTFYIEAKTFEDIYQFMKFSYYSNSDTSPLTQQYYLKDKESTRFSNIYPPKEKNQQFSMKEISWLTDEYARRNLLFLKPYWDSDLLDFLEKFYICWEDYRLHWDEMCKFIRLIDYKSYQIQEKYKNIYPKSQEIIEKFMNKFGQKTIANTIKQKTQKDKQPKDVIQNKILNKMMHYLKIQDHVIDQIIRYLIRVQHPDKKDEKFKLSISNELLKGKPVNFSNLIAVIEQFQDETSKWQDVLHLVFKEIYKITIVSKTIPNPCIKEPIIQNNQQKSKKFMNQETYLNKIQNQKLIKVNCLGCSQHFLYNMNIQDNSVNKNNLIVFQKAEQVQLSPLQVKLSICGLINSIEGGIILFGCQKKYLDIHTQGSVISQPMKREFVQIIQTFRQSFYPRLKEDNLIVNFVPIIANPYLIDPFQDRWLEYQSTMRELKSTKYVRRKYYEGTYVMRIIVRPIKQGIIHYFEHDQNETKIGSRNIKKDSQKSYKFAIFEDSRIVEIPISQLRKTIKKFYVFHIDSQLSLQTINILKIPSLSNHKCLKPDQGLKVTVKYDDVPQDTMNVWWQKFNFMTQVVSKRKYLLMMRENLRQMGHYCEVQKKFLQYDLQSARNTAVIYHDINFSQLKYIIKNNNSFARIAAEIEIFPIKSCVKVWRNRGKKLSLDDEKKLKKWFNTEFPSSKLKSTQSIVDKERSVIYFKGSNKIETFFIYLILKNFNENAIMEDELVNIAWKVSDKESENIIIQASQFKSKLCTQAQLIYDILIETTKNNSKININKPSQQRWIRNLCFSLINQDIVSTWQRMLESGQRKDLVVKFIQKMAESKQLVFYLGQKITQLWKMMQYEDKDDSNLQLVHSICSLQADNYHHQNDNLQILPLKVAEEVSLIKEKEDENTEILMSLIEQTSRRHSKVLLRMYEQQIPEFCINQIPEQTLTKQFGKVVFNVQTFQQFLTIRDELESILPSIDYEPQHMDYQKIKYEYSNIIIFGLLTWTHCFQRVEDCEIIKLFERLLFEDKRLSDWLLENFQNHAERISIQSKTCEQVKAIKFLKNINFLLSTKLFAFCDNKLDSTRATVQKHIEKLQQMQTLDQRQAITKHCNNTAKIQQYIWQQFKRMQHCLILEERIQNWIESLQNKQYGWTMANPHYVLQLLSKVKNKDVQNTQQIELIIKYLVEFTEFITKEIAKITFKTIKESYWLFNLLKNNWIFQEFKKITTILNEKINIFEMELYNNLLRMINEFLLEKRQKIDLQKDLAFLQKFIYILEKARQLLPLQKFTQLSNYKKEQVVNILRFKINWQALQSFCSNEQYNETLYIIFNILQNIQFRHYIQDFLMIDIEQLKKKYQTAPQQNNKGKYYNFYKGQSLYKKFYYHQDQQIVVNIKKGVYGHNQIVVYSKNDSKNYSTFRRLQREEKDFFLFQHELEQLSKNISKRIIYDHQYKFLSSPYVGMEQLTAKWLLQRLMKNNNKSNSTCNSSMSNITISLTSSKIDSEQSISAKFLNSQSLVNKNLSLQDQMKQCQQQVISQLFDLYVNQYRKIIKDLRYNKHIEKTTFRNYYQIFQSLKKYRPFMDIIFEKCFVQKAANEINYLKNRNNYFPQEDFNGLDPVQTYKKILVFEQENRQLSSSLNSLFYTAGDPKVKQNQKITNQLQELYESITDKQKVIEKLSSSETINLIIEVKQFSLMSQRNIRKQAIFIKLGKKIKNIKKIIMKSVNNFCLNVEDFNQIYNQLVSYLNNLEFVCIAQLQKRMTGVDITRIMTQFKGINERAKDELQKIFYTGSETKYFITLIVLFEIMKKTTIRHKTIKEECNWIEKDLTQKLFEVISKEKESNNKKIQDLRKRMRLVQGAEVYFLANIESDIQDLQVSIMKIAKLNTILPEKNHLVDFEQKKYLTKISQWKYILEEKYQTMSEYSRFDKNIEKTSQTLNELLQLAFQKTIKTFHQSIREEQISSQNIFFRKLLKGKSQNFALLDQKIQLLGKIIAIFDITHLQCRKFQFHFKEEMTVQTTKISQQLRHILYEVALKIQQKLDLNKFFVINCSLQDRIVAVGIISIYLAITTQKQVSIACQPFFANKCQQLFQQVLKNCNLQNKVKICTYKSALIDALGPIIKTTNEEISKLFNYKDKDMERIMIERKGDQQIIFPNLDKKILMLDQPSAFFDFLKQQNVFAQTITLSDPILQKFLKIIKRLVSLKEKKFLTKVLMQNTTKTFFKQHPIFDKIFIQQIKKMVRDVKDYKSSYQIVKGKLIHEDCNGRLNEDLHYGYKTIFSILEEYQADKIAAVHKKSAVKMEIMLNLFDLLPLEVYFEKIYGFVEYKDSLCSPSTQYFMKLYKVQKETIFQSTKEQDNPFYGGKLLTQTVNGQQNNLDKIIELIEQSPQFNKIVILKDNKEIQELAILQKFSFFSKQSWIIKSKKDTEWPFYQQKQHLQKNIIVTTQEYFKFILKHMLIYQLGRQQAKNTIIICSFKPRQLHSYKHIQQYIGKVVFIEAENIIYRQDQQILQEYKCLENLKNRQRQSYQQKSISRYRFVNNILALNMIKSRLLPNINILICINANSQSLRLFDFRLFIQTVYQTFTTRKFNLFTKILVFRRAHKGKERWKYVETPFSDDPNPLLCFLKDFEPEDNFDPADTQDMLKLLQSYQASRYFVFVENIQKTISTNQQKVKLIQMPFKRHHLNQGQTIYEIYKKNQESITDLIFKEIQIINLNVRQSVP